MSAAPPELPSACQLVAYDRLGSPEGELAIANAVVYLACAAKSNAVYVAMAEARADVERFGTLDAMTVGELAEKGLENRLANGAGADGTKMEHLSRDRCLQLHRIMVRTRAMEERMIKMSKSGEGYFWIGGPGEEAFNAALGLQVKKGEGAAFDFLHLHYRNSATLVAMGMPLIDGIRQMGMALTDPHSAGRNFPGHFARRDWNVMPVSSVIENQHVIAPGTAWVMRSTVVPQRVQRWPSRS